MQFREHIVQWAEMTYAENPYGISIPEKYLYDARLIRSRDKNGCSISVANLAEIKQNGNSLELVARAIADAPWEKMETISFSPIFHRLVASEKMCPSNYVVEVINELDSYNAIRGVRGITDTDEFYIGTIARSLRALASYIREYSLADIIEYTLSKKNDGKGIFKMYSASVEQDMRYKTDIMFEYDGRLYRAWSYQTTRIGIERTANRIQRANGSGYNILFPFNFEEKEELCGWYLYDFLITSNVVKDLIVHKRSEIEPHWKYAERVRKNNYVIKYPAVFEVY